MRWRIRVRNVVRDDGMICVPQSMVKMEQVEEELTVSNPAYFKNQAIGASTRGVDPELRMYSVVGDTVRVPRHYPVPFLWDGVRVSRRRMKNSFTHTTSIVLRDDIQRESVAALVANDNDKILSLACGGGKTAVSIYAASVGRRFPVLVVVHTNALMDQWWKELKRWYGLSDDDIGVVQGDQCTWDGKKVAVAMLHTLVGRVEKWPQEFRKYWRLVVFDECFPYGTLVDGRRIEDVRVGDFVRSFDESTKSMVRRRVSFVFRKRTRSVVRLSLENGRVLVCTKNHPILSGNGAWVQASLLRPGDVVQCVDEDKTMRSVQPVVCSATHKPDDVANVLSDVQSCPTGKVIRRASARISRRTVSVVWGRRDVCNSGRKTEVLQGGYFLLRGAWGSEPETRVVSGDEEDASRIQRSNSAPHVHQQSGVVARSSAEDTRDKNSQWYVGVHGGAWGERSFDACSSTASGRSFGGVRFEFSNGVRSEDRDERKWGSVALQNRHRVGRVDGSDRAGREFSFGVFSQSARPEERRVSGRTRVESIEIYEQGRDPEFDQVCPGGVVFNLEVEGTHTYTAEGVIVHNCHRIGAAWFGKAASLFPCERWGLSATLKRSDGMDQFIRLHLGDVAYSHVEQPLKPAVYVVPTGVTVEDHRFMTRWGRVNFGFMYTWLCSHEGRNKLVLQWIRRLEKEGRTILVLGERVEQLWVLHDGLKDLDAAVHIGSMKKEERREAMTRRIVLATQHLAKEGLDRPEFDTLLVLIPIGDPGRVQQSAGRILRELPGKKEPRVFVFQDESTIMGALTAKMLRVCRSMGFPVVHL